ncbi:MAG: hypothetical protein E4H40_01320 [Candidatus Brocadiia bacterium]|nr:MAG: hypothetical protein E4H40_01320 [Candidatus Brocadiia bacterium]
MTKYIIAAVLITLPLSTATADTSKLMDLGNKLYSQGNFNEAVTKYDEVILEDPAALEPKFNKADSYYRLDDLSKAAELYKEVTVQTRNMKLLTMAKYNLGNCSFQQGIKQKDSDLQKAVGEMKTAIGSWRSVLDIDPANEKAAKNIEVARLMIKDLLDQLKNQPKDPNQPQQQQQQNQKQDPNQPQQQQKPRQDPNQPKDPNEQQKQQSQQQKEEQQQQKQQDQQQKEQGDKQQQEQQKAPDTTAQQILDKEQEQQKNRQMMQRVRGEKVDKDW